MATTDPYTTLAGQLLHNAPQTNPSGSGDTLESWDGMQGYLTPEQIQEFGGLMGLDAGYLSGQGTDTQFFNSQYGTNLPSLSSPGSGSGTPTNTGGTGAPMPPATPPLQTQQAPIRRASMDAGTSNRPGLTQLPGGVSTTTPPVPPASSGGNQGLNPYQLWAGRVGQTGGMTPPFTGGINGMMGSYGYPPTMGNFNGYGYGPSMGGGYSSGYGSPYGYGSYPAQGGGTPGGAMASVTNGVAGPWTPIGGNTPSYGSSYPPAYSSSPYGYSGYGGTGYSGSPYGYSSSPYGYGYGGSPYGYGSSYGSSYGGSPYGTSPYYGGYGGYSGGSSYRYPPSMGNYSSPYGSAYGGYGYQGYGPTSGYSYNPSTGYYTPGSSGGGYSPYYGSYGGGSSYGQLPYMSWGSTPPAQAIGGGLNQVQLPGGSSAGGVSGGGTPIRRPY